MTRKQTPETQQDEPVNTQPAIPPGVEAQVNVKYTTRVDPNQDGRARERDELSELVELAQGEEPPPDDISAFCYQWQNFAGYPLAIIRLPDPPERRMAGNSYARPCFNLERLGDTTFDPSNLIGTLQFVNHNSGGVFRVWLTDYNGAAIPGARVERIAIGDPPQAARVPSTQPLPQPQPAQPAPPPVKSDSERQLDGIKDQLFTTALQRALNPQTATQPAPAQLPPEQQATLFLLGNTEFMPNIFKQMTALAQQAAGVDKEPTWKERAIDAGLELATKNPLIVDRLSGVVERLVDNIARIVAGPPVTVSQFPPQQVQQQFQQPPTQPPQSQTAYTGNPGMPEAPDPSDDPDTDEETMDIIDKLLTLVNSEKELTLTDPLFTKLQRAYPIKFRMAIRMIIAFPLEDIINWIKETGGPAYVIMLDGPASGPFLRGRLGTLQALIIEGNEKAKQNEQAKQQAQTTPASTPASDAPES